MPITSRHVNMTQVLAHRGSAKSQRENTLGAFKEALRLGADGVELDVRRTLDGHLVVHHDPVTSDGMAIGQNLISDLPEFVPELGEAFEACGDLLVNVELKADPFEPGEVSYASTARLTAHLCAARLRSGPAGALVVSSFSLAALEVVAAEESGLDIALLVEPGSQYASRAVEVVSSNGWSGLHPFFQMVDQRLAGRAREAGLSLRPWTVDRREHIVALRQSRGRRRDHERRRGSAPRPRPGLRAAALRSGRSSRRAPRCNHDRPAQSTQLVRTVSFREQSTHERRRLCEADP